jgi:CRP-like cAMP-binding protein
VLQVIKSDQLIDCMPWSRSLSSETKGKLFEHMNQKIYNPGDCIAEQGRPLDAIGAIVRGTLEGKEIGPEHVITAMFGPGETIAVLALLSAKSPATYTAESPVEIIWFSAEKLKVLMGDDPILAKALAALIYDASFKR